jgi:molybdopterin converting factor small subunit
LTIKVRFSATGLTSPLDRLDLELEDGATLAQMFNRIESIAGPVQLAGILAVNMRVVVQEEIDGFVLRDGDSIILAPPLSGG